MTVAPRYAFALLIALPGAGMAPASTAAVEDAPGRLLSADDFSGDLPTWETNDERAFAIVDSGDADHGRILELRPSHPKLYALISGSESWPAYRLEGPALFSTDGQNYLGFIFNLRQTGDRFDLGSLYLKGNGSYIRVKTRRDWDPARMLYEELRVALDGEAAIVAGGRYASGGFFAAVQRGPRG